MLTKEQIKERVSHPDWPEYLEDIGTHWHWLIELGEYDDWRLETVNRIEKRIREMEDRFRRTFFPGLP